MRVLWTELALQRIQDIDAFISMDSPVAAEKWVGKIFERGKSLSLFPKQGRIVPERGLQKLREIIVGNYRLIYRISSKQVSILSVVERHRLIVEGDLQ